MPIIVEDGTGLPNATSYIDVAFAKEFSTAVGHPIDIDSSGQSVPTEQMEIYLTNATLYMDAHYRYIGQKLKSTQSLKFPRTIFSESDNTIINIGVPIEIKRAQAYLSILDQTHGLINTNLGMHNTSNANANRVETSKRIKVGEIEEETKYSSTSNIQNITIQKNSTTSVDNVTIGFGSQAEALLIEYIRSGNYFERG